MYGRSKIMAENGNENGGGGGNLQEMIAKALAGDWTGALADLLGKSEGTKAQIRGEGLSVTTNWDDEIPFTLKGAMAQVSGKVISKGKLTIKRDLKGTIERFLNPNAKED